MNVNCQKIKNSAHVLKQDVHDMAPAVNASLITANAAICQCVSALMGKNVFVSSK